jgi:hypothetical protein
MKNGSGKTKCYLTLKKSSMNLQYISDSKGRTTGVFIPINEWNDLKNKYKGIEQEEINIPEWHKDLVRERVEDYKQNPDTALDFDATLDDIEKDL